MTNHNQAVAFIVALCREHQLHPSELLPLIRKEVRLNSDWKGLMPAGVQLDAQRELATAAYL